MKSLAKSLGLAWFVVLAASCKTPGSTGSIAKSSELPSEVTAKSGPQTCLSNDPNCSAYWWVYSMINRDMGSYHPSAINSWFPVRYRDGELIPAMQPYSGGMNAEAIPSYTPTAGLVVKLSHAESATFGTYRAYSLVGDPKNWVFFGSKTTDADLFKGKIPEKLAGIETCEASQEGKFSNDHHLCVEGSAFGHKGSFLWIGDDLTNLFKSYENARDCTANCTFTWATLNSPSYEWIITMANGVADWYVKHSGGNMGIRFFLSPGNGEDFTNNRATAAYFLAHLRHALLARGAAPGKNRIDLASFATDNSMLISRTWNHTKVVSFIHYDKAGDYTAEVEKSLGEAEIDRITKDSVSFTGGTNSWSDALGPEAVSDVSAFTKGRLAYADALVWDEHMVHLAVQDGKDTLVSRLAYALDVASSFDGPLPDIAGKRITPESIKASDLWWVRKSRDYPHHLVLDTQGEAKNLAIVAIDHGNGGDESQFWVHNVHSGMRGQIRGLAFKWEARDKDPTETKDEDCNPEAKGAIIRITQQDVFSSIKFATETPLTAFGDMLDALYCGVGEIRILLSGAGAKAYQMQDATASKALWIKMMKKHFSNYDVKLADRVKFRMVNRPMTNGSTRAASMQAQKHHGKLILAGEQSASFGSYNLYNSVGRTVGIGKDKWRSARSGLDEHAIFLFDKEMIKATAKAFDDAWERATPGQEGLSLTADAADDKGGDPAGAEQKPLLCDEKCQKAPDWFDDLCKTDAKCAEEAGKGRSAQ